MKNFLLSLIPGIGIGVLLCNLPFNTPLHVKKEIVVTFSEDIKNVNFYSNKNYEGDTYLIILGKDTVCRGVIRDNIWVEPY